MLSQVIAARAGRALRDAETGANGHPAPSIGCYRRTVRLDAEP